MAEKFNKNGYNADDFKRNAPQDQHEDQDGEDQPVNEKVVEYTKELLTEKLKLDMSAMPHCSRLLDQEIERSQTLKVPPRDNKYADLYHDKLIKVDVKVLIPVRDYPRFNFVGKLLGPKGNTMKKLKDDTMCKISVFGKGSMRDKKQEDELRNSLDPKYAHLNDELHVGISALAPPAEAYARIAFALAEVRKYLIPDMNDPIRQEQMHEMYGAQAQPPPQYRLPPPPPPPMVRGPPGGPPRGPPGSGGLRGAPRGGPRGGGPGAGQRQAASKANVMSILDRARASMEESYGFNESYDAPAPPQRHNEDQYSAYYDESGQQGYYRDNAGGGGQASGSRPGFKPRGGGIVGGGLNRRDNRPFNRAAPYGRAGK